jgi:PhnB protein
MGEAAGSVREFFPCLCIDGAAQAIDFYRRIFAADVRFVMHAGEGEGRTTAHAEVAIGPMIIMVSDPYPEDGVHPPPHWGGTPVRFHLHVDDVDRMAEAATEAGATVLRGPQDEAHGERQCLLRDPWGHYWLLGDG